MTRSSQLLDAQLRHSIGIHRRSTAVARRAKAEYRRLEDEIRRHLATVGAPIDRIKLQRSMERISESMREHYDRMRKALGDDSVEAGEYEVEYQSRLLRDIAGIEAIEPVRRAEIEETVYGQPIVGVLLWDWTRSLEEQQFGRVNEAIRESDSGPDATAGNLVDGVFQSGALALGVHHLGTWARTVFGGAVAKAKELLWGKQPDIEFFQWIGILDSAITTHICLPRHSLLWDAKTLEPVQHDLEWGGGPGRIHHRCRSVYSAILRGDGIPDLVDADTWLRSQRFVILEKLYGRQRARLYLDGNLSARDLVGNDGEMLTLGELRRFDLAGDWLTSGSAGD